jgi:hypothetical protein
MTISSFPLCGKPVPLAVHIQTKTFEWLPSGVTRWGRIRIQILRGVEV